MNLFNEQLFMFIFIQSFAPESSKFYILWLFYTENFTSNKLLPFEKCQSLDVYERIYGRL